MWVFVFLKVFKNSMGQQVCYLKSYNFVRAKLFGVWTSPLSINIINVHFKVKLNFITLSNGKKGIYNFDSKKNTTGALAGVAQWIKCWTANQRSPVQFPVGIHACVAGQVPRFLSHVNVSLLVFLPSFHPL